MDENEVPVFPECRILLKTSNYRNVFETKYCNSLMIVRTDSSKFEIIFCRKKYVIEDFKIKTPNDRKVGDVMKFHDIVIKMIKVYIGDPTKDISTLTQHVIRIGDKLDLLIGKDIIKNE